MKTMTTQIAPDNATVVATLQRHQANAMVLYQNIKKYHWNTFGPLFRDIHLLFDEIATRTIDQVDEYAERAFMLDGKSLGDPADYPKYASVKSSNGEMTLRSMIEEEIANLDLVIKEMHQDAETATGAGDIGTADLYTRLVQVHQKDRWFLKETLRTRDGITS
ncbi:MAG: DNA starvation/stationary phase protection protein [Candidatus Velthaea sp.]